MLMDKPVAIRTPENRNVLKYLKQLGNHYISVRESPDQIATDPYMHHGCHPDTVERVLDVIGRKLPQDCRMLVYGTPCLVNPAKGTIFVICNGTAYNIKLTEEDLPRAKAKGLKTTITWSGGEIMDAAEQLGEQWLFGGWEQGEIAWCNNYYKGITTGGSK
jgi:hypothetical protein